MKKNLFKFILLCVCATLALSGTLAASAATFLPAEIIIRAEDVPDEEGLDIRPSRMSAISIRCRATNGVGSCYRGTPSPGTTR
ncbi:MAG: hypothetical protein FWE59_05755 [Oscillospiraceae bacterium]|nr:hypothetical protein [Oscillospiraceae bacterium]